MNISKQLSNKLFEEALTRIVSRTEAETLLQIEGVYEALSEEFNNEVMDIISGPKAELAIDVLSNDETSTDQELYEYIREETGMKNDLVSWFVDRRVYFLNDVTQVAEENSQ